MMSQITLELPTEFAKSLGGNASRETLVAAALRWFEEGRLSQGQAAELLGMSRGEFFDLLHEHRVSLVQMSIEDLEQDFRRG